MTLSTFTVTSTEGCRKSNSPAVGTEGESMSGTEKYLSPVAEAYDTRHPHINTINTQLPQTDDLKDIVCVDKTRNTHTANLINGSDHSSFKESPMRNNTRQQ